jgi:RNA polymerase sigma factor (sigma-70 family)
MDDLRPIGTDVLLRRLARAHADGRPGSARRERDALIVRALPRVRGAVAAFRFPGQDVTIPRATREEVVQEAVIRTMRMLANLERHTEAAFGAAVVTTAQYTCRDWCRRTLAVERGLAGHLEEPARGAPADDVPGRFTADLARLAERARGEEEAARETADALERAIRGLANPVQRRVIELTRDGWRSKEIAAELDLSVPNVDQLRSRGFKLLRKELA